MSTANTNTTPAINSTVWSELMTTKPLLSGKDNKTINGSYDSTSFYAE
jgi:hypothetical protein